MNFTSRLAVLLGLLAVSIVLYFAVGCNSIPVEFIYDEDSGTYVEVPAEPTDSSLTDDAGDTDGDFDAGPVGGGEEDGGSVEDAGSADAGEEESPGDAGSAEDECSCVNPHHQHGQGKGHCKGRSKGHSKK